MDTKQLKQWAEKHINIKEVEDSFWEYLKNWYEEHPEDFYSVFKDQVDTCYIQLEMDSIQLTHIFNYGDFVYCNMDIKFLGEDLGLYRFVYTTEGEVADNMIKFDNEYKKWITMAWERLDIIKNAIQAGLKYKKIVEIIDVDEVTEKVIENIALKMNPE